MKGDTSGADLTGLEPPWLAGTASQLAVDFTLGDSGDLPVIAIDGDGIANLGDFLFLPVSNPGLFGRVRHVLSSPIKQLDSLLVPLYAKPRGGDNSYPTPVQ
jgi:hypothetical protein